MKLTPKQIKLEVTRACALDLTIAPAITTMMGEQPLWSKLDAIGHVLVWLAYKSLTERDPTYYNAYLALAAVAGLDGQHEQS